MARVFSLFRNLLRRDKLERDLDDELRAVFELLVAEKLQAGMRPDEARRQARLELGNIDALKDRVRDSREGASAERLLQDLRYAWRVLGRQRAVTAAAVLTLALGIGANVAVFTVVDAVLFRPLPFDEPDRLVRLSETHAGTGQERVGVLPGSFLDWRERARGFEALSMFSSSSYLITNRQEPERLSGALVSPNFFELLGVRPIFGRTFPASEAEAARHPREVVISYGLWQRWFGGSPDVLGRTLEASGWVPLTIVGVMPRGFDFPRGAQLWSHEQWKRSDGRGDRWRHAIGRLGDGVSQQSAERELGAIAAQLAREFPQTNAGWTVAVDPLSDVILGAVRPSLAAMLAAVVLLFLVACVNVATVLLQRVLAREREFATRAALGATRWRLVRQTLVEHAVLAGAAAILGGWIAMGLTDALVALAPPAVPRLEHVAVDGRVLAYLTLVALVTLACAGLLPAVRASRVGATAVLRSGPGGSSAFHGRGLVVLEVALVVVLLSGASLMVRTMLKLHAVDLGFEPAGVLTSELALPISRLTPGPARVGARPAWDQLAIYYAGLVEQIEALPRVRAAALVSGPTVDGRDSTWFARSGIVPPEVDGSPAWRPIKRRIVTPGYFDVLRLPVLRGRAFTSDDQAFEYLRSGKGRRRGVAIVNSTAARQFWPGKNAIGQALTIEGDSAVDGRIVVGLSADARDVAPDIDPPPTVYVPFAERPNFAATLLVSIEDTGPTVADIRRQLRSTDPALMIGAIRPLSDVYAATLATRTFITSVLATFAAVGLLVAAIGLYGVMGMSVSRRTREFGIRLALGARWNSIRGSVLREAAVVLGLGALIGGAGAAAGMRLLRTQLFGVGSSDTVSWLVTMCVLGVVGLAAAWMPARRAASVDPVTALRWE